MFIAALHDVLSWHVELEDLTDEDVADTGKAHVRIAQAIVAGDPRAAEAAMRRHLQVFRDRMEAAGRLDEAIIPRSHWQRRSARWRP
jgi:DNA-binding FadR family transcriptional regulator